MEQTASSVSVLLIGLSGGQTAAPLRGREDAGSTRAGSQKIHTHTLTHTHRHTQTHTDTLGGVGGVDGVCVERRRHCECTGAMLLPLQMRGFSERSIFVCCSHTNTHTHAHTCTHVGTRQECIHTDAHTHIQSVYTRKQSSIHAHSHVCPHARTHIVRSLSVECFSLLYNKLSFPQSEFQARLRMEGEQLSPLISLLFSVPTHSSPSL